jgi:hypothetical protein
MLRHDEQFAGLYTMLGVPALSEVQLMARILLPHFNHLADPVQTRVLERMLARWGAWKAVAELCTALADTPFVLTGGASSVSPV